MKLCDYGCGEEAKYQFKNGKWCCSENYYLCKSSKTLSEDHKRKIKQSMKCKKIRQKISLANIGNKNPNWKGGYDKSNIPRYDYYKDKICYAEEYKRNKKDRNILEVKCAYCGEWFIPSKQQITYRITCLTTLNRGEGRLYCSDKCKKECPIFNKTEWPEGFKTEDYYTPSREVQPELRQLRFKIDKYTCQKCNKHQSELQVGLNCHHIEGLRWEPLESADIDKVITYCVDCHKKVHKIDGCGFNDMKCKQEDN